MNLALEICIEFLLVNNDDKIISVKMIITIISMQCTKKVMSKSLGLVDFAIGLVNLVLNLPDGQRIFLRKFTLQKNWNSPCSSKLFSWLIKMTPGLVNVGCRLLER